MFKMIRRVLAGGPPDRDVERVQYVSATRPQIPGAEFQTVRDQVTCTVYGQVTASVWDQVDGWSRLTPEERRMLEMPDA